MISIPKQAVTSKIQGSNASGTLHPTPDGRRLLSAGGTLILPDAANPGEPQWRAHSTSGISGDFQITPDGRFGVATTGAVWRLGRGAGVSMVQCGNIEANLTSVGLKAASRVLLFTAAGFVKEYATPSLELVISNSIGIAVHAVVAQEDKGVLFVFGVPTTGASGAAGAPNYGGRRLPPPGDLFKIEIPK